jgi:RNA polymerase sigma factor (sigma-70 family)
LNLPNESAFLENLNAHKGILYKLARMYTNTDEDKQDLEQEIIIQLWKSYSGFKGESKFSTWMYRVAVNTAITFLRNERRKKILFTPDTGSEPAFEPYNQEKDKQLEIFYMCVQLLKPVEKALIFYFMEGLTHRDIGNQLGISEVNARVKLNRTKEKLQDIIKKHNYEY